MKGGGETKTKAEMAAKLSGGRKENQSGSGVPPLVGDLRRDAAGTFR